MYRRHIRKPLIVVFHHPLVSWLPIPTPFNTFCSIIVLQLTAFSLPSHENPSKDTHGSISMMLLSNTFWKNLRVLNSFTVFVYWHSWHQCTKVSVFSHRHGHFLSFSAEKNNLKNTEVSSGYGFNLNFCVPYVEHRFLFVTVTQKSWRMPTLWNCEKRRADSQLIKIALGVFSIQQRLQWELEPTDFGSLNVIRFVNILHGFFPTMFVHILSPFF